jgi:hypothetical protein
MCQPGMLPSLHFVRHCESKSVADDGMKDDGMKVEE